MAVASDSTVSARVTVSGALGIHPRTRASPCTIIEFSDQDDQGGEGGMRHVEYLRNIQKLDVYSSSEQEEMCEDLKMDFDLGDGIASVVNPGLYLQSFRNVTPKFPTNPHPFHLPLTAADLTNCKDIACKSCSHSIKKNKAILSAKDLPSSYWVEMVDFWSCHKSEFAGITEQVRLNGNSIMLPKQGMVHCGLGYLLFHPEDIHAECPGCGMVCGIPFDGSIKVSKHAIICNTVFDGLIGPVHPLLILASMMHERMEAQGSYHFTIINEQAESEHVCLRLLNWSLLVGPAPWRPAIKVQIMSSQDAERIHVDQTTFSLLTDAISSAWPRIADSIIHITLE